MGRKLSLAVTCSIGPLARASTSPVCLRCPFAMQRTQSRRARRPNRCEKRDLDKVTQDVVPSIARQEAGPPLTLPSSAATAWLSVVSPGLRRLRRWTRSCLYSIRYLQWPTVEWWRLWPFTILTATLCLHRMFLSAVRLTSMLLNLCRLLWGIPRS